MILDIMGMDDTAGYFVIILIAIGSLVLLYLLLRYIFETKRQILNQERIIALLSRMAEKQGVSDDDITEAKLYGRS